MGFFDTTELDNIVIIVSNPLESVLEWYIFQYCASLEETDGTSQFTVDSTLKRLKFKNFRLFTFQILKLTTANENELFAKYIQIVILMEKCIYLWCFL